MMHMPMRTTVNIKDHLLEQAKSAAAQSHRTLGEVIDDALQTALTPRRDSSSRDGFELPTSGGSGLQPGVDLEDREALADRLGDNTLPDAAR
jgi:hypothetical protein